MNELLQSKILDKIKMCLTIVLGVNKLRDRKTERRERERDFGSIYCAMNLFYRICWSRDT